MSKYGDTTPPPTCQVRVSVSWDSYPCGRPVKADGKCGIHLAVDKRRAQAALEHDENRALAQSRELETVPLKEALDLVGIRYNMFGEESYGQAPSRHEVHIPRSDFDRLLEILYAFITDNHLDQE